MTPSGHFGQTYVPPAREPAMRIAQSLRIVLPLGLAVTQVSAQVDRRSAVSRPPINLILPGGPPVSVVRVQVSGGNISLRWSCAAGASGYEVFGAPAGNAPVKLTPAPLSPNCLQDPAIVNSTVYNRQPGSTAQTTYSTGYTHAGLPLASDFTYMVRTLYPAGGPADSDPIVARTAPYPPPVNVQAGMSGLAGAAVRWDPVRAGYGFLLDYVVARKLAGEPGFRDIASWNIGSAGVMRIFNDVGIPPGVHQYRVKAVNGDWSNPADMYAGKPTVTPSPRMTTPQVVLGISGQWPGAVFKVYASAQSNGPFTDVTATGGLSWGWVGANVPGGTTVYYKVSASYPGVTLDSDPVKVTVPQTPTIPGITATYANGVVTVSWPCAPGIYAYEIARGSTGSNFMIGYARLGLRIYPTLTNRNVRECKHNDALPQGTPSGPIEYRVIGYDNNEHDLSEGRTVVVVP
jgi:hypothetical protein